MDGITATPRLSPQAAAAATAAVATPVILVDLDFTSGPFRAWTGLGPLDWAGLTFEGVGSLGAVGDVEETTELRAVRLTLTLSPVPQEVAKDQALTASTPRTYKLNGNAGYHFITIVSSIPSRLTIPGESFHYHLVTLKAK